MTPVQRIQLRQGDARKRLSALIDAPEEQRSESYQSDVEKATNEIRALEIELQAALVLEPEPETRHDSPEGRELRAMLDSANVGNIFAAAFERRSAPGGVEEELQQHFRIGGNAVPLAMLETRAVTPLPNNASVEAGQRPIVQPVFSLGDAAYLGVDMPTVPAGDAVFPVLTTRPTVGGPHKDSTAVAETTGAFTTEALEPGRLQASFFYRRTDAMRFPGMGEALRAALSSGLSEALDKETVDQIVTDVGRTAASAEDTWDTYRSRFVYSAIDGRYATGEGDLRYLVGSSTLEHMAGEYRAANTEESAADTLRRLSGGVRVSPHVAAVSGNKQDVLVRKGSRPDAVAPLWEGVTLIPDEITKAGTGEIVITALLMAAFKVIRTDGFARIQSQHA